MENAAATAKTPGYNSRLTIKFSADKNGRPLAHYWSMQSARYFRIGYDEARMAIASGKADQS